MNKPDQGPSSIESQLEHVREDLRNLQLGFFSSRNLDDEEVDDMMIAELAKCAPARPPMLLRPGDVLFNEGEVLEYVYIRLEGSVKLTRTVQGEEMIFHSDSAGRILGLLALASRERLAFYSCTAKTQCRVLKLSLAELELALQNDPTFSIYFLTAVLRNLVGRNRRAVELQIEIKNLNRMIARERDFLTATLQQLENAQMKLVESEKMATLGQLVAGVAHELNNPVAALLRAADFLQQDLRKISAALPDGKDMLSILEKTAREQTISSREQREIRTALSSFTATPEIADRLAAIGIRNKDEMGAFTRSAAEIAKGHHVDELELYHQIGTALRNIHSASARIGKLVSSLRSYSRSGQGITDGVDIHAGIEESLSLLRHLMKEVELVREYGDVPPIQCSAGQINQVWTNLITNAVQAMDGKGTLTIRTGSVNGEVAVSISDSGHGIPPENLKKIFDLNFTTKAGKADFGIGLGLPICKQIVERHNGRVEVESAPGRTCFTVTIPITQQTENSSEEGVAS